jgi:hypothetical protein
MINIRFQYPTGAALAISIEQLATGLYYDFTGQDFLSRQGDVISTAPLPEDSGPFLGRYALTMAPTPNPPFADGDYVVTVHDTKAVPPAACVVAELALAMFNGSDATVFPARYWKVAMTGSPHRIV